MKHWGKKLAALLLCAAMATGLMPGMHLTALAYDGNPYAGLVGTTTTVKFNGMEWYLIEDGSTAVDAGYVTLLAKDPVGACAFSYNPDNHYYSTSDVKNYLAGLTADGGLFAGVADAIAATDLSDVSVTGVKLYLLSTNEAESLPQAVRKCSKASGAEDPYWWLRSPGDSSYVVAGVNGEFGKVTSGLPVGMVYAVRPALRLDLTKVKFYTVNVSGGANTTCDDVSAGDVKNVFLLDGSPGIAYMTFSAKTGYEFPETSEYYKTTNGITVQRDDATTVLVAGKPKGVVDVTVPDAKLIQIIDASDVTVTYGDTGKSVSASVLRPATGGGAISYAVKSGSGDYIDVDATTGALTVKKVPKDGKAYVTVTAAETDSCWAATEDVTVTVSKAQLTIKANDQTCTYDGSKQGEEDIVYSTPEHIAEKVEVSNPGLKNNDELKYIELNGVVEINAGKYEKTIKIVAISIKNGDADVTDNYSITLAPGDLVINPKEVSVTGLTATDRAYEPGNQEVALSGGTVTGVISGDDVDLDLTGAKGTMADDTAGTDKPVTVSGVKLSGTKARNYSLDEQPAGVTVTITKADQDAPVPPTAETVTGNSVTLKKTAGYQYSMEGTSWQDSNVFNGLAQDTEYTFYQRLAGDENHEPSPSSEGTEIRTGSITYTAVKTEGDRQTAGRNTDLVVEIKRSENDDITYGSFAGVKMDGRDVPEKDASGKANWTAAKGSLVLTVKSTYMETLSAGDHTLMVSFKDGSVEIPVTISAAETSPKTGDASNLLLWSVLALLSLAGIAVLTASKASRKKRQ